MLLVARAIMPCTCMLFVLPGGCNGVLQLSKHIHHHPLNCITLHEHLTLPFWLIPTQFMDKTSGRFRCSRPISHSCMVDGQTLKSSFFA
ncbi:hypothetical protein HDV57DRAFT_490396 [Trichoderma longibrachiatum]